MKPHLNFSFAALFVFFLLSCSNEYDGKDGIKTVYFPNSEIVKQIVEYKDGKRIGELKEFYRNGNLKIRQLYKNDSLTDSAFFYHENGKIAAVQYLKDFKKHGIWTKYNEQGKLYDEVSLKEGYLDGVSTKYTYRTGRVLQRLTYSSGMKEGKQELFYNNGKPKAILYFHNDEPCAGTEEWTDSGEKIDNDFKISINEQNRLLLENRLMYFITLEDPREEDEIYVIAEKENENYAVKVYPLERKGNEFYLEYKVGVGGFIMENIKIAAFRKSSMGNMIIKTKTVVVSANNF